MREDGIHRMPKSYIPQRNLPSETIAFDFQVLREDGLG